MIIKEGRTEAPDGKGGIAMKRRISALALTLCLLLGLAAEQGSAATVYFTAVNDTLLELSDATMPYWSGKSLYVPASAFGSGGLGISYSYNTAKKTLTLRRSGFRLICNLASGMTVDSNGTLYDFLPLEKGGQVFLPINDVCRIFSLSCSTRSVANGYLVRIRNDSASFTDDAFLTAASAMLASRYQDYAAAHRQNDSTLETDNGNSRSLYLALTVRSAAQAQQWLDAMSGTAHHATLFLTEEFFRDDDCGDALRRALAEGHTLGLAVPADSGAMPPALRGGNELLRRHTQTRTRLVLTGAEKLPQSVSDAGYCAVAFDLSCAGTESLSTTAANQLLSRGGSETRLELGDRLSADGLRTLLRAAEGRGYTCRSLRETAA